MIMMMMMKLPILPCAEKLESQFCLPQSIGSFCEEQEQVLSSDVNKDWTHKDKDKDQTLKDQDKDKDQTCKDKDKDKDQTLKDKDKDLTYNDLQGLTDNLDT